MNNRRSFIGKVLATGAGLAGGFTLKADNAGQSLFQQELPSLEGRKVLFTWGGWDGHEPKKFMEYLTPWLKDNGADVSVFDNLEPYTDKDLMNETDLLLQVFTMSQITQEQEKGLLEAVKGGMGMAGWHGGMGDSFRVNTEYQYMVGGQWVSHPGGVIDYDVKITDNEDPITRGLSDFKMNSEQYYMHVDPNVNFLATTEFSGEHNDWIDGCTMPVIWKKTYGKGRIFYTSLGHNLSHVVDVPEGMTIIKRGIQWASASKYAPSEEWITPKY